MHNGRLRTPAFGAAALIFLVSLLICLVQTYKKVVLPPVGGPQPGFDFAYMFTAGKCWGAGVSPYRAETFAPMMYRTVPKPITSTLEPAHVRAGWPYPPNATPFTMPLAGMDWHSAMLVWWAVGFLSVLVILGATLDAIVPHWKPESKLLFAALFLQSRLIHYAMYCGQTGLFAFALVMLAAWLIGRRQPLAGGIALALSLMKFTYGLPMIVYYARRREWKFLGAAFLTVSLLLLIGLAHLNGLQTLVDYRAAVKYSTATGAVNDTGLTNPFRLDIANVSVILYNIVGPHDALVKIAYVFVFGVVVYVMRRAAARYKAKSLPETGTNWLEWAAYTLIGYIFLYHRNYDNVALFPIGAVLLEAWRTLPRQRAPIGAGLFSLFLAAFVYPLHTPLSAIPGRLAAMGALRIFAPVSVWLILIVMSVVLWLYSTQEQPPIEMPGEVSKAA